MAKTILMSFIDGGRPLAQFFWHSIFVSDK